MSVKIGAKFIIFEILNIPCHVGSSAFIKGATIWLRSAIETMSIFFIGFLKFQGKKLLLKNGFFINSLSLGLM